MRVNLSSVGAGLPRTTSDQAWPLTTRRSRADGDGKSLVVVMSSVISLALTFPRDPVVTSQKIRLDPPNLQNSVSNHLLRRYLDPLTLRRGIGECPVRVRPDTLVFGTPPASGCPFAESVEEKEDMIGWFWRSPAWRCRGG